MREENEKAGFKVSIEGFDPLGLKSAGEISKELVKFGIEGAKEFLKLTCKPLLEEFGLAVRDQFTNWKLLNVVKMLEKAKGKIKYDLETEKLVIDPRIAYQIVEHASIVSNETLQDMWAGLFAASCDHYEEDENILFIDILKRLTSSQVKLLNYLCEKSRKDADVINLAAAGVAGVVTPIVLNIKYNELFEIMETTSRLKVDSEFSALESMGLIMPGTGSPTWPLIQQIKSQNFSGLKPTLMAIRLYVKGKGSNETPFDYFLPEIIDFYYEIIKAYVPVTKTQTLDFITETAQAGSIYDKEITYGTPLIFSEGDWADLPMEEFNRRMRAWIIYRWVKGIGNTYILHINKTKWGTFSYKDGVIKGPTD